MTDGESQAARYDDAEPREEAGFRWDLVDPDLTRSLLRAAASPPKRLVLERKFAKLKRDAARQPKTSADGYERGVLAETARGVLARGGVDRMLPVCPVLTEQWLPNASDGALARLTNIVETTQGLTATRQHTSAERLRFLQRTELTYSFQASLIKEFRRDHSTSVRRPRRPRQAGIDVTKEIALKGAAGSPLYRPHPHVKDAWAAMDRLKRRAGNKPVRARVVLPTGAGKTDVAVGWTLQRLEREPDLRVLWLSHQVSLLEQAARRFETASLERHPGFKRQLRIFAQGRTPMSLFRPDHTDIACATIQTVSRDLDRRFSRRRRDVQAFLRKPLVIVIDEAHHSASNSYQTLLNLLGSEHDRIGLTATPWGPEWKQARLDKAFPDTVIRMTRDDLIGTGVLASFKPVPIRTGFRPNVTEKEHSQAKRMGDLPGSLQRKLEAPERTQAIIDQYMKHHEAWGRTLLFAPTINNADDIADGLLESGVNVRVLHSYSDDILDDNMRDWFKTSREAVLVSVAMLLEGVDLPNAQTALIARPTTSPIILNQMVGRVLRGPKAGGDPTANVIYMRDDWDDFMAALGASGPWDGPDEPPEAIAELPIDVADALEEAMALARAQVVATKAGPRNEQPDVDLLLDRRAIVGYIQLDTTTVPVFDHQFDAIEAFLAALDDDPDAKFEWPEDAPPPPPVVNQIEAVRTHMREHGAPPLFSPAKHPVAPEAIARALAAEPNATTTRRIAIMRAGLEDKVTRALYPEFEQFAAAVARAEHDLRRARRFAEAPLSGGSDLEPLPRNPDRSDDALITLRDRVMARAVELAPERRMQLVAPKVKWSNQVASSYLAHWRLGDSPSEHVITVNLLLQTDEAIVPDELLELLLWHEIVHSITPGHGHDQVFQELEDRWPGFDDTNAHLDRIVNDWSSDPRDYVT